MTQRRGFTLVEVLLALVIMGVVTGAIYQLLNTNQRLALAQAEQVSLQSNVRTGSLIVPNELRELNTVLAGAAAQNDVTDADPDGITYRAMRGLGFVCQAPAGNQVTIASSSWTGLRAPDSNRDDLYVFVDGNVDDDGDDAWQQVDLTGAVFNAAACVTGGYVLTGAAAMPVVPLGTPVRAFELMRLELYDDGGEWWLGAQSLNLAGSTMQPMLGPLTADGFTLEYLDRNGNETAADPTAITSIRIAVRGLTDKAVRAGGTAAMGHPEEALATQVLLRNSIRP